MIGIREPARILLFLYPTWIEFGGFQSRPICLRRRGAGNGIKPNHSTTLPHRIIQLRWVQWSRCTVGTSMSSCFLSVCPFAHRSIPANVTGRNSFTPFCYAIRRVEVSIRFQSFPSDPYIVDVPRIHCWSIRRQHRQASPFQDKKRVKRVDE